LNDLLRLVIGLFCFATGLCVLAAAGHGLWLLGAAAVRAVSGAPTGERKVRTLPCSACGAPQGVLGGECVYCGFQPNLVPAARRESELRTAHRVLARLRAEGELSEEQFADLESLLGGRPATPPAPAPAEAPVARETATSDLTAADEVETITAEIAYLDQPQEALVIEAPFAPMALSAPARAEVHPLDRPEPSGPPAAPQPTFSDRARGRLADVLTAFMEEKNIRWGEVLAGLLIVGSAIGCVVSLQETIREADPYVPAALLMLATSAIFGAGVYTLRRWDLKSVSRAVLIIAMLLIPLNFLAATSPGEKRAVTDPIFLLAVVVGLGVFTAISWSAGRILTRDGALRLTVAVMGASASQLYLSRLADPEMGIGGATLLFSLPAAAFLFAIVGQTWQASQWKAVSARRAEQTFIIAGVAVFALLTAWGLTAQRAGRVTDAAEWLSPTMSIIAAAVVALGLAVARRAAAPAQGPVRATALAIALLGGSLMVANLLFAWPEPGLLIAVGALSFLALATLALAFDQPALHGAAIACFTIAFIVGFHLVQQETYDPDLGRRMLPLLWMGRTSVALSVVGLAAAGAGGLLARGKRPGHGVAYLAGGGVLMAVGAMLALGVGFTRGPDSHWTTPLLLAYAFVLLAVAVVRRIPVAAATGALLLLAGLTHALAVNELWRGRLLEAGMLPERPVLTATLLTAAACIVLAWGAMLLVRRRELGASPPPWDFLVESFQPAAVMASMRSGGVGASAPVVSVLSLAAVTFSALAAPFALWVTDQQVAPNAAFLAVIAVVWLAAAWLQRLPALMSAFGWAATATVIYGSVAIAQQQAWWNGSLLHPRHVQLQLGLLAVWSLAWSVLRRLAERRDAWRRMLNTPWAFADEIALGAAVLALIALAATACIPGVAAEMGIELPRPLTIGGADPALAYDFAGWTAFALIAAALAGALIARVTPMGMIGLTAALAAAPLLAAGPFEAEAATASACRWWFAVYGIVMCAAICARRPMLAAVNRTSWLRSGTPSEHTLEAVRGVSFLFTLAPIAGLTLLAAARFLAGADLGGPLEGSWFARLSPAILYAGPMLVLSAILVAYAVRERAAAYMMLGSVLLQGTVTLACLLALSPLEDAPRLRVELLQWNAAALGAFSLIWLALRRRVDGPQAPEAKAPVWLQGQLGLAALAVAALGAWSAGAVFLDPDFASAHARHLGKALSYVALGLTTLAGFWRLSRARTEWVQVIAASLMVAGALAAVSAAPLASPLAWTGYYVLVASWGAVMALMTAIAGAGHWRRAATSETGDARQGASEWLAAASPAAAIWATLIALPVIVLAAGASLDDPLRPWWSAGSAAAAALCAAVLSIARNRRGCSYAGAGLAALAATFVAIGPFIGLWSRDEPLAVLELIEANLIALIIAGGASLAYTLWRGERERRESPFFFPPVHAVVAIGVTGVFAIVAFAYLLLAATDAGRGPGEVYIGHVMGVLTAAGLGLLLGASLWHARGRYALPCLYVWGAVCIALGLDHLRLEYPEIILAVTIAAASYVMITGLLWRSGIGIAKVAERAGVPDPVEGLRRVSAWLPGVNALQALPWTLLALGMVLSFEDRAMRVGAAAVPLLLAIGVGSLAQQKRRDAMQLWALVLASVAAVFFGWADVAPHAEAVWLVRCVRMLIVLTALAAFYGGVVIRLLSPDHAWRKSVRRMTAAGGAASLATLVLVLLLEWTHFVPDAGVRGIEGPQIFAVAAVLAGLIAALISVALLPDRDPLSLTEDQRMWYVYTAEVVAALLFAHIYMTMPHLFSGFLSRYWAYIVVAIAFAGVGVGELFRRSGVRVLAEPLGRTGAFLPLLPALAFWAQASLTSYSGVLFWIGLLYVVLTIQHKSVLYGVAAGLAGNAALWALMQGQDFTLLEHPQFWLIPPALSALVATHLTREHLTEAQLAAVRYLAMLVIYLSSTGEMFITGVGESLWPVMALTALSVLGVLAGIGLRVRAFLYLGAGFLTLSVISMVWHASKALHHVWPWWAFLFLLGVAILVLFAVFEKRRDAFLERIQKLQTWEM
jgi:hypothetical protein